MLKGKYLNPKYAKRQKKRRRFALAACSLLLVGCCAGAIYRIDATIRSAMLPNAPPVAAWQRQQYRQYRIWLFGQELSLSTDGVSAFLLQLEQLLHTPPPAIRLSCQLYAWLTGELPRNVREDTRNPYGA